MWELSLFGLSHTNTNRKLLIMISARTKFAAALLATLSASFITGPAQAEYIQRLEPGTTCVPLNPTFEGYRYWGVGHIENFTGSTQYFGCPVQMPLYFGFGTESVQVTIDTSGTTTATRAYCTLQVVSTYTNTPTASVSGYTNTSGAGVGEVTLTVTVPLVGWGVFQHYANVQCFLPNNQKIYSVKTLVSY